MAWLADRGAEVVGCDPSWAMIGQARTAAAGSLLQMDMRHLGLRASQFQGIWCCASLLHLPRHEAPLALAEMQRVLVPGGLLFLSVQEGIGEGWERCSYATVERWFARYSQNDLAELLSGSGFTVLETAVSKAGSCRWLQSFASAGK